LEKTLILMGDCAARLTLQHFENFGNGIDAGVVALKPKRREKRRSLPWGIYAH
jgi:hypothetical protein